MAEELQKQRKHFYKEEIEKKLDQIDKLDPSSKVHYLDDLKIIQNCLNMIKTELRLKK